MNSGGPCESGIEVLLTGDGTLVYEQNLDKRSIAVVALSTNNWPIIKNHVPTILAAIDKATPGSFQVVECGRFSRKRSNVEAQRYRENSNCPRLGYSATGRPMKGISLAWLGMTIQKSV